MYIHQIPPLDHDIYSPCETNSHEMLPLLDYSSIDEYDYSATMVIPRQQKERVMLTMLVVSRYFLLQYRDTP
jgi:hypothetical protein